MGRLRSFINQSDTALSTEVNLTLALENYGVSVDFETVWGQGHVEAKRTGSSTENVSPGLKSAASNKKNFSGGIRISQASPPVQRLIVSVGLAGVLFLCTNLCRFHISKRSSIPKKSMRIISFFGLEVKTVDI